MNTQEHNLEGELFSEESQLTQAEVDAEFEKIIGELEQPSPEADRVKDIVAYKSVQRGEPVEHNYKHW